MLCLTSCSGNFGVVQKVKRITTGELFAMKVIDKMKITNYSKTKDDQLMEVHILKILRHPSIRNNSYLNNIDPIRHYCSGGCLSYNKICVPYFRIVIALRLLNFD